MPRKTLAYHAIAVAQMAELIAGMEAEIVHCKAELRALIATMHRAAKAEKRKETTNG